MSAEAGPRSQSEDGPREMEPGGVLYELRGNIAVITLNRPEVKNAQNLAMLYALDRAFYEFSQDDAADVAVLRGAGSCFSAGHDMGSAGMDYDVSYPPVSMWWDHVGKEGVENWLAWEEEAYVGMSHRWRDIPKPTIAMVHGPCIAAGLMLAWPCDLIIASEDATFSDPVLRMGVPGVELFAHPWELGPRQAKELLFLGDKISAERARELGMVNRVVPSEELEAHTMDLAERIAEMPRLGLVLAKKAVNRAQDAMGYRTGTDVSFGLHQLAQAHNQIVSGGPGRGHDARSMRERKTSGPGNPGVDRPNEL
ncbi:enoyl-CoA hydratase [Nocardioides sp. TF02-7]|uniref:enoyl-CoA hydratase n=1 Tax=Nocardioides sp. TF02-7 TaxID=2917724 RepID=UPI001F06ADC3|nr:enoyl-CoA hydratase [Nocardioides sp. TF02-7]UMG91189.1 enoyl-CoA hydratase [Nocardioides sp. TF02-7]